MTLPRQGSFRNTGPGECLLTWGIIGAGFAVDFAPRGGSASAYRRCRTVILKLAVAVLALVSVAEQWTRLRPMRNRLPEGGRHLTGTGPSTASLAVTRNFTRTLFA